MKTTTIAAIGAVILVLLAFVVAPAMAANADNGLYTSKYAPAPVTTPTQTGIIKGIIRAHQNDISTEVKIAGPSGTFIVPILADGTFELNDLAPGLYTIVLPDGNGGQPEFATATVRAGQIAFPEKELLGHAITVGGAKVIPTVINATYGMIETRERIVTDAEAYDEYIPAVTHQDYEAGHVHAKEVMGHAHHDFLYMGHKMQIVGNQAAPAFIVDNYFWSHRAALVTIIDVPAQTIHHDAVTHIETYQVGSFVDVTAEVQKALNNGITTIVFDNAKNPGGLFDAKGNLVAQIDDPAPGIVKSVVINIAGGKHIEASEYDEITI